MQPTLDTNTIVISLTSGIGPDLGRKVRSSFYRLYERLPQVSDFKKHAVETQQLIVDILALSIFYNTVIFPLESGRSFQSLVARAGATHIRIGKTQLDQRFGRRMNQCIIDFEILLNKFQIPPYLLTFANLKDFVQEIISQIEIREHETLDR